MGIESIINNGIVAIEVAKQNITTSSVRIAGNDSAEGFSSTLNQTRSTLVLDKNGSFKVNSVPLDETDKLNLTEEILLLKEAERDFKTSVKLTNMAYGMRDSILELGN